MMMLLLNLSMSDPLYLLMQPSLHAVTVALCPLHGGKLRRQILACS